jgi:predicted RNA binding protein with dsRBD fold (UPF0201 family)
MKAIFSHIYNSYLEIPTPDYIKMCALANFFAKKQGFETVFYGDEKILRNFKKINFDYTERIPTNAFKDLPKCFWSASKLISLFSINEPCIHIDNDLFLTRNIPKTFLENDIICFHDEKFLNDWPKQMQQLFKIQPKETQDFESISYNCGIIGGQDISIIKKSIGILFDYVSANAEEIDRLDLVCKKLPIFTCTSVLIEQIWLFQIFQFFKKEISTLLTIKNWGDDFDKQISTSGYLHLMKNKKEFLGKIDFYLNKLNIQY